MKSSNIGFQAMSGLAALEEPEEPVEVEEVDEDVTDALLDVEEPDNSRGAYSDGTVKTILSKSVPPSACDVQVKNNERSHQNTTD